MLNRNKKTIHYSNGGGVDRMNFFLEIYPRTYIHNPPISPVHNYLVRMLHGVETKVMSDYQAVSKKVAFLPCIFVYTVYIFYIFVVYNVLAMHLFNSV